MVLAVCAVFVCVIGLLAAAGASVIRACTVYYMLDIFLCVGCTACVALHCIVQLVN